MALKRGQFCWSRKKRGKKCRGVLGREPTFQVSRRHAVGDEGAQVAEKPGHRGGGW
jgi:hypothetical protein